MGSDVAEVQEAPFDASCIKVHQAVCTQLLSLLKRIEDISKDIEEVRPRCKSGIEALCLLQNAREKAKELVQNCREYSKLYLALTGDTIVSRFEKTKSHFVQSLSELQSMVPVVLQLQINEILYDLGATQFQLDLHEKEAGKALRALLEQDATVMGSYGNSDTEILQFAASRLQLTTQKDLLIERRSIHKQLNAVMEEKSTKKSTLEYLSYLLKKNKQLILQGMPTNPSDLDNVSALSMMSSGKSRKPQRGNAESHPRYAPLENPTNMLRYALVQAPANMLDLSNPPEEFLCPLSSELMCDPVVIASGRTFERIHIQKWFDDGHDTCPITRMTLADQSLRPNSAMKDLISKWRTQHGTPLVFDSNMQNLDASSISIGSNASSLRDLNLQIDISNVSIGSLDSSYSSGFSNPKPKVGFSSLRGSLGTDSCTFRFYKSTHEIRKKVLSNVNDLPWESRCKAVQDVKDYFMEYNPSFSFVSDENFLEPLVQFLNDALNKPDVEAQKAGVQLFLAFLKADREEAVNISENVHTLLASLLRTESIPETLAILETLSSQSGALSSLTASGALPYIFQLLDNNGNNRELQAAAIRILSNLSSRMEVPASSWVPKLVPLLKESLFAGTCIAILENLSKFEAGRVSIVHTKGCIASIIELLQTGSSEDQERAIAVLLSLCLQRESYCWLVLNEGGLPPLYQASVNGTEKVKVSASELLRQLMDVKTESDVEQPKLQNNAASGWTGKPEKKHSGKKGGSFGRKIKTFFGRM